MSIHLKHTPDGQLLVIHLNGKLTREDYQRYLPEIDRLIKQQPTDKLSMLVEMRDFHGWGAGAFWDDLRFALGHYRNFERLAMVGEKTWQKAMSRFCEPFTSATIRYFDHDDVRAARDWVQGKAVQPAEEAMAV